MSASLLGLLELLGLLGLPQEDLCIAFGTGEEAVYIASGGSVEPSMEVSRCLMDIHIHVAYISRAKEAGVGAIGNHGEFYI